MVPHASAIDAGQDEKSYDQISMNVDHSSLVKFSDPSNHDYCIIERRVKILAKDAPKVIKERFKNYNSGK